MAHSTAISASVGIGGLSPYQLMLLSCDSFIWESYRSLVRAFLHGSWIPRKWSWKIPGLFSARFKNLHISLTRCIGHSKAPASPDSREGETQFNPWCQQWHVLSGWRGSLATIFAGSLRIRDQLSLKTLSVPSRDPCSPRNLHIPHVEQQHGVESFRTRNLKLDFWILSLAVLLAHCQISIKLFNVFGLQCSQ